MVVTRRTHRVIGSPSVSARDIRRSLHARGGSMSRIAAYVVAATLVLSASHAASSLSAQSVSPGGASVDPLLDEQLRTQPAVTAVVTFRRAVDESVLADLRTLGIVGGYTFRSLPIVLVNM